MSTTPTPNPSVNIGNKDGPPIYVNRIYESEVFETTENFEIEMSTAPTPSPSATIGNKDDPLFV
ncbi:hypothetical protein TorRG33x02_272450 [Trema orientale]|uniref:Uncharacterized protein n=1 Tax=Trema orientale TaxID=63057 RepID=A0A2P5CUC4_TREOI|nr:hypothetical protein TorRG33x02_272450 [Trema orientale]